MSGKEEDNIVLGCIGKWDESWKTSGNRRKTNEGTPGFMMYEDRMRELILFSQGKKNLRRILFLSPVIYWVVADKRISHSSFSEMARDRRRGNRHKS